MEEENRVKKDDLKLNKKSNDKLLAVSVIIILLLIGSVIIFKIAFSFKTQKINKPLPTQKPIIIPTTITSTEIQEDKSIWNTYTNKKFGIEFKYPTIFKYQSPYYDESSDELETRFVYYDPDQEINRKKNIQQLRILIVAKKYNDSIDSYIDKYLKINNFEVDLISYNIGDVKGYTTYLKPDLLGYDTANSYTYMAKAGNYVYLLYLTSYDVRLVLKNKNIFDQIMSTFKFSTITQTNEDDNWKTYVSDQYKFEIKYPGNWTKQDGQSFKEANDLLNLYIWGSTQKEGTELYDGAFFTVGSPVISDKDIASWMKEYYGEKSEVTDEPNVFSQRKISGITYDTMYQCGLGCFTYYHIKHNGQIYRFLTSTVGPEKDSHDKIIDQILSSLKFY